jgi:hypothetical protein
MIRAFHFLFSDMRSDEDMFAGNERPWQIGEARSYVETSIEAGGGVMLHESGYHSSPTLWDAFLQAHGPVACLVEVSEPVFLSTPDRDLGCFQASRNRRLLAARTVESELRAFACDCAERVLNMCARSVAPHFRRAIEVSRRFARGHATEDELREAFVSARGTADAQKGATRASGEAIVGAVFAESGDGAILAVWSALQAVKTKGASFAVQERKWQRDRFERTFGSLFG